MRRTVLMLVVAAAPLAAQQQQSAPAPAAPAANAAVAATKGVWDFSQNYLVRAAEQMPESLYAFRPTQTVRTFGQIIGHVAGAQYMFCAVALGETPRAEDDVEKTVTSKAGLVKALKDAGKYCERAYAISDAASSASVNLFGMNMTKMGVVVLNASHVSEHYGNIVTYLRIKGFVPPSSQPSQQ